jgi:tetratricopeptide (TPR) repeat protein
MINSFQQKEQANTFRKQGLLEDALPIYKKLWTSPTKDKFDAAGYLHCLRKLKISEEAMELAIECEKLYTNFTWCRIEIIWTYIGSLKQQKENASLASVLPLAIKIMNLSPDDLQKNITVLFVLKKSKQFNKLDIACQWIDRINPDTLDKVPVTLEKGSTAWSNYLIWHHHKVRCLIYQKEYQKAIDIVGNIIVEANQVSKYFRCLEAHAFEKSGQINMASQILKDLCQNKKLDWWILHQYANLLKNSDKKELSLVKMYHAASIAYKIESIVTLLHDISLLCKELNRMEESYYHIMLHKLIREKKGWLVKEDVNQLINEVGSTLNITASLEYREVLMKCKSFWGNSVQDKMQSIKVNDKRKRKNLLKGHLTQVKENNPFCFIKTSETSYFCYKSDITGETNEGQKVQFDAIPSFDRKKNKESWKAVNIVLI